MNVQPETPSAVAAPRPPQLIQSLASGFNAVANHIYLILLPVLLDLLLWFGPHLRLKTLLEPSVLRMFDYLRANGTAEMQAMLGSMQATWKVFLDQYNLFGALSTLPIGVPSMMAGQLPVKTPLGVPPVYDIAGFGQLAAGWLALSVLGLALGCIYFASVAACCNRQMATDPFRVTDLAFAHPGKVPAFRPGVIAWQAAQTVLLLILLFGIMMVLIIPAFFLTTILSLISPALTMFALLLISFGMVWFLVPLIFSPHGIYLCGQSALNALFTSARLVRYSLSGTGLFLLACVILYQGLGMLWRAAPDTSWMTVFGIFGNAFVTTGLLAASFVYYRGGLIYLQSLRKRVVSSS